MTLNEAKGEIKNHKYLIGKYIGDETISYLLITPMNTDGIQEVINLFLDEELDDDQLKRFGQQFQILVLLNLHLYEPGDVLQYLPLAEVLSRLNGQ